MAKSPDARSKIGAHSKMTIRGPVGRAVFVEGDYTETNYHYYTPRDWDNTGFKQVDLRAELRKLRKEVDTLKGLGSADRLQAQAEIARAEELSADPKAHQQSIQNHLERAAGTLDKARDTVEKAGALAKALVSIGNWVVALI